RNRLGRNRLGRNRLGRNRLGRNRLGRSRLGRDWLGRDWLGHDWLGRNRLGHDWLGRWRCDGASVKPLAHEFYVLDRAHIGRIDLEHARPDLERLTRFAHSIDLQTALEQIRNRGVVRLAHQRSPLISRSPC
ncbi:MAG: hypothetical protein JXR83_14545, partial [Deltaproteobacteria bacterium]|nr:hypothetical protein [Deltaproteobacteria bacterium]